MAKSKALGELIESLGETVAEVEEPIATVKPDSKKDKFAALAAVEKALNKQFDTTHSLVRLGSKVNVPIPSFPTGLPGIDRKAIGTGGIPKGRIIEIFGPESSGKTTITLHIIAQAQKQGELAAFIDAEHALDPTYANKLGVNVDDLFISQPDSGEQALETVIQLVKSRAVGIIVVDSVAALVPQAELDGEMGDSHMGLAARMMSQAMRKLTGICAKTGVTVIFINQIREKIGVMFGSPETTTGGRALKFYSSVRIDVRRIAAVKDGDLQIGQKIRFKVVKNKCGAPFRETEIELLHDSGINTTLNVAEYALEQGAIEQKGAWFSFQGERLGQGLSNVCKSLETNPTQVSEIMAEVDRLEKEALDKAKEV